MKIGSLVKISKENERIPYLVGWFKTKDNILVEIFKESEIYGIFLGNPIMSNGVPWYEVLVNDRIYIFQMRQINLAQCQHFTQEDNL